MAVLPVDREVDIRQAEHFYATLAQHRAELCDRLDAHALTLDRYERVRDAAGVRRVRRRIKEIGTEIREIDRMMHALRVRLLGTPREQRSV